MTERYPNGASLRQASVGLQTIHRRTEPANGSKLPRIDEMCALVELVDRSGYDSLWVGDHISFPLPILDPLLQLAQAATPPPSRFSATTWREIRAGSYANK